MQGVFLMQIFKKGKVNSKDITQIGTVLAIVVICYLVGIAAKLCPRLKDKGIPVIVGACGGILGVVGMYVILDFPANDG